MDIDILGPYVLCESLPPVEKKAGNLFLPNTKETTPHLKVVAVGDVEKVTVGCHVIARHAHFQTINHDGVDYIVLSKNDIIGVLK